MAAEAQALKVDSTEVWCAEAEVVLAWKTVIELCVFRVLCKFESSKKFRSPYIFKSQFIPVVNHVTDLKESHKGYRGNASNEEEKH